MGISTQYTQFTLYIFTHLPARFLSHCVCQELLMTIMKLHPGEKQNNNDLNSFILISEY